jgi:hypothetical protein
MASRSRVSPWLLAVVAALILITVLAVFASTAQAAANIVLDGQFADWDGQAFLPDPQGESGVHWKADIKFFYWATNPGEEAMYFMVERYPGANMSQTVTYCVHICPHGGSTYDTAEDWQVLCHYDPDETPNAEVRLYHGDESPRDATPHLEYGGNWGLTGAEGGTKVEFSVSFADIGISVGQSLTMYLDSLKDDAGNTNPHQDICPDTGDIQWAPVHTLGLVLTVLLLGAGLVFGYRAFRYGRSGLRFPRKAVPG